MKLQRAIAIGRNAMELLRPACEVIALAGSCRRMVPEVKDIELVAVPKVCEFTPQGVLFPVPGKPLLSMLDQICHTPHSSFCRGDKWGQKYRQLLYRHNGESIAIDLFMVEPESWGPQLAIRTGPAGFSKRLVAPGPWGLMPKGYRMFDGCVRHIEGGVVPLKTEEEFFRFLRVPYWAPDKRSESILESYLDRHALA